MDNSPTTWSVMPDTVDCACVIHGNVYPWSYVDRLYNMLSRNISPTVRLHVYTESQRTVPPHMIKHDLVDWGISGPRKSWWYKMQLFNSAQFAGPLLYFDLDVLIVNNIDWIWNLPLTYFWTIRDFKYLWRPMHQGINSSVMAWDTRNFDHVWSDFEKQDLNLILKKYAGDQDYITQAIGDQHIRFIDDQRVKSWRWQCLDGGYNFLRRAHQNPGFGTVIPEHTDILIFHGHPKPGDLQDPVVLQHWK